MIPAHLRLGPMCLFPNTFCVFFGFKIANFRIKKSAPQPAAKYWMIVAHPCPGPVCRNPNAFGTFFGPGNANFRAKLADSQMDHKIFDDFGPFTFRPFAPNRKICYGSGPFSFLPCVSKSQHFFCAFFGNKIAHSPTKAAEPQINHGICDDCGPSRFRPFVSKFPYFVPFFEAENYISPTQRN